MLCLHFLQHECTPDSCVTSPRNGIEFWWYLSLILTNASTILTSLLPFSSSRYLSFLWMSSRFRICDCFAFARLMNSLNVSFVLIAFDGLLGYSFEVWDFVAVAMSNYFRGWTSAVKTLCTRTKNGTDGNNFATSLTKIIFPFPALGILTR